MTSGGWDRDIIPADHWLIRWLDEKIVQPLHMKDNAKAFPKWWSPSGWRVFAVTFVSFRRATTPPGIPTKEWLLLKLEGPGLGTKLWENGLLHFAVHLPFCLSLHLKLPIQYAGERWGYALQAQIGWKVFGNLSATFRVQPDLVDDYNTPTQHWRARGLEEGAV